MKLIDAEALKRYLIDVVGFYPAIVNRAIEKQPIINTFHIDRGKWSSCECNGNKETCCTCVSMLCHSCFRHSEYKRGRYCSSCGRPLTEKAWEELEKRLEGME